MTEARGWNECEDRILKLIRDQEGVQKWSTIAQRMAQEYGIKGRNGKQCKQRYMEVFDQNNQVLHWDYETQQLLFMLHDKVGNKWAAIGQQLNSRTDNDVKNHFYSKIRKGLRKINQYIKVHFRKEHKQIKQTVLYKIIQGTQDRFIPNPIHEEDVWSYCIEVKNSLLRMSYDEDEFNPWNDPSTNSQAIKDFIENLSFFSREFKRKPRTLKKNQEMEAFQKLSNLHTNHVMPVTSNSHPSVCESQPESSEVDESQSQDVQRMKSRKNSFNPSYNQTILQMPVPSRKAQRTNSVIILKYSNHHNQMQQEKTATGSQREESSQKTFRTMLPSIPKLIHTSSRNSNIMIDQEEEDRRHYSNFKNENLIQSQLLREGLLQQDDQKLYLQSTPFNGNNAKNITSKGSNFSSYSIQEQEEVHFFEEDSTLNMRIYTTGIGGKKTNYMGESIQKSDKLFKSVERGGQLFQSLGSRGMRDLQMSMQRSGDLKRQNSLFQSVG